jgi:type II restriction enzyme
LRLLADGKLFAADENLNRLDTVFFPLIKIFREETLGARKEYSIGKDVRFFVNGELIKIPSCRFSEEAEYLLQIISNASGQKIKAEKSTEFLKKINVEKIRLPDERKADIFIEIHDIQTGYEPEVGFSIKSRLGEPPTLFNASKPTNFTFEIVGAPEQLDYIRNNLASIQGTESPSKYDKPFGPQKILKNINNEGCDLKFCEVDGRFRENLLMIDSQMPIIIAEMLVAYYSGKAKRRLTTLANYVVSKNPLALRQERADIFYKHKVKSFLCAAALGLKPSVEWDGTDEASGGYIIVKQDGEVVAYHIYNRDKFKEYLFNNTHFEGPQRFDSLPPKTKKGFDYGYIYEENDKLLIKLNLQIRFI